MTKDFDHYRNMAIELAELSLRGELADPRDVTKIIAPLETRTRDKDIDWLVHLTMHFITDVDIRQRDPAYHALQSKELQKALERVKSVRGGSSSV